MAGLEPIVMFWTGWGIHFMVVVSFMVQVTLLLVADIRRYRDWAVLKVVIWSAYILADTTAIYTLGHMSVVCRSTEHHLMALWAPLLLVHLGGQDNITAYAIEDNRLWLRHLQTYVLQVAAAGYVLYVSSILTHPSDIRSAAILMFVVGVLKYGERIWALKRADSCASSSLSATSYDKKVSVSHAAEWDLARAINERNEEVIIAYSLLDVPKQMFEGPTSYVQISNLDNKLHGSKDMMEHFLIIINKKVCHEAWGMLSVVDVQLSMMYDLLYTKAAVVHTWYGLCSRLLISLPFTVAALALLGDAKAAHKRVDVAVTNVLLVGAVVLETMSLLRAIFSKWTAVLMYEKEWYTIGNMVFSVIVVVTRAVERLVRSAAHNLFKLGRHSICRTCRKVARTMVVVWRHPWLGHMRQHSLFVLMGHHYTYSVGRKMAKRMRLEDWWDSNVYSWSTEVPVIAITKVLDLVSTTEDNITKSQGLNAVRRHMDDDQLADWIWMEPELKLEERILVWHIATHVYRWWWCKYKPTTTTTTTAGVPMLWEVGEAVEALANYMFFLLAARPYMLPYPVSRQAYVQLCHEVVTHFPRDCTESTLLEAILDQMEGLVNGTPLQLQQDDEGIGRRQGNGEGETGTAAPQPQPQPHQRRSTNTTTLDRACQLAAKLIHITANETLSVIDGVVFLYKFEYKVVLDMVFEVWVEMLCYTANLCNENYHAKHLTDGGEFMTFITLLMIYVKNGLIK